MNEYTAWDLYDAPLYFAREANNDTIAQRQEEALRRRGRHSQRRRNMLRHDGPHGRRYRDIGWNDRLHRHRRELLNAELTEGLQQFLTPAPSFDDDIIGGPAEDYISGTYPYFEQRDEEDDIAPPSVYDGYDGWDDAYDLDDWRTPRYAY